jgi:hypothetical protein
VERRLVGRAVAREHGHANLLVRTVERRDPLARASEHVLLGSERHESLGLPDVTRPFASRFHDDE